MPTSGLCWSRPSILKKTISTPLCREHSRWARHQEFLQMDLLYVKNQRETDSVGQSPIDRGSEATNVGVLVDIRSILVVLACHCGYVLDIKAWR